MLAQYFHSMTDKAEALSPRSTASAWCDRRRPPAGAAVRRRTAARTHRPRTRQRSQDHSRRRAHRQPGRRQSADRSPTCSLDLHAQGRTILMVTHDPVVARLADRRAGTASRQDRGAGDVFPLADDEQFDEVLEELWVLAENGELSRTGPRGGRRRPAHAAGAASRMQGLGPGRSGRQHAPTRRTRTSMVSNRRHVAFRPRH